MNYVLNIFLLLFLITIPFVVSISNVFTYIYYVNTILLFLISLLVIIKYEFKILKYDFFEILSPYYTSVIFSIMFGFIPALVFFDHVYNYYSVSMYGRIFNTLIFSILAWFIYSICVNKKFNFFLLDLLKGYAFGCFLLILSGYWHALYIYFSIPFPFETRSHLHGAGKNDFDIAGRITGFAAEPSFFVPFVLDFMIISLIIFKNKIFRIISFSLGLFIFILSFAPSGYMSLVGSFTMAGLLSLKVKSKKALLSIILLTPCIFLVLIQFYSKFSSVGYVLSRIDNIFQDTRFLTISEIYEVYLQSNIFNFIFGYGVSNFKFASVHTNYNHFHTSNNMVFDLLIEVGFLGLILVLFMFYVIFQKIRKASISNYQKFIAYALFFDIVFTGLVRADYASARFFILIAIICLLCKFDYKFGVNKWF